MQETNYCIKKEYVKENQINEAAKNSLQLLKKYLAISKYWTIKTSHAILHQRQANHLENIFLKNSSCNIKEALFILI